MPSSKIITIQRKASLIRYHWDALDQAIREDELELETCITNASEGLQLVEKIILDNINGIDACQQVKTHASTIEKEVNKTTEDIGRMTSNSAMMTNREAIDGAAWTRIANLNAAHRDIITPIESSKELEEWFRENRLSGINGTSNELINMLVWEEEAFDLNKEILAILAGEEIDKTVHNQANIQSSKAQSTNSQEKGKANE